MIADATIGKVLHTINTLFFVYWILWVAVTPFVDTSHVTQRLFPPREYGLAIPVLMVTVLVVVAITVSSVHIIRNSGLTEQVRKRREEQQKAANIRMSLPPALSRVPIGDSVLGTSPRNQRLSSPIPAALQ
jgi:dolichol phosphate-mannose biosynthesis regulatory protein